MKFYRPTKTSHFLLPVFRKELHNIPYVYTQFTPRTAQNYRQHSMKFQAHIARDRSLHDAEQRENAAR
jgi:hypothetical protein